MRADLAAPLGASPDAAGTTFRLWSEHADGVELCLFDSAGSERRIELIRDSGGVWNASVPGIGEGQRYGYRVHGPFEPDRGKRFNAAKLLLDPYARRLEGPILLREEHFTHLDGEGHAGRGADVRDSAPFMPKSVVAAPLPAIDEAERPRIPTADSVIYELHVKGFTRQHPEIPEPLRGTYAGLAHPAAIAYLRNLGVTAVELLPVQQQLTGRFLVERGLVDYWGYNTIAFMAPDPRLAATPDPRAELRATIRALHDAGIEVLLDVVYNHTGEGDEHGPTIAFRGIDNEAYYRLKPTRLERYRNDAGTGNTLNATHPAVVRMILDSLHVFADEFGADGYRFDLATSLGRNDRGFSAKAPLFEAIAADPGLRQLKLIAEPWDLGTRGYRLGQFPVGWSEWNGRYRDSIRRFWAGRTSRPQELALRVGGSPDLFEVPRGPAASVNFVTSHDGFTLRDMVSYAAKHNEANGEANRDGEDDNSSVNFGVEGDTDDPLVLDLRDRQRRALLATLLCSRGAVMLLAGDEIGRTQRGNNNAYSQDNKVSWLNWKPGPRDAALLPFVRMLVGLRRDHPLLRHGRPIVLGELPLALLLTAEAGEAGPDGALLLAMNQADLPARLKLPAGGGGRWAVLLDTARDADAEAGPDRSELAGEEYELGSRSVALLALPAATPD
ncbi:MAG: glycogen debranching protein GlgX [Chloroflexota bacterium]|nr:glycogen debranching protein GlgX [Chloroflexota bacterium]